MAIAIVTATSVKELLIAIEDGINSVDPAVCKEVEALHVKLRIKPLMLMTYYIWIS